MSVGSQFSLCWGNYQENVLSGLSSMLENEDLVDVTIAVEGRYLKAHKMVLSLCSPYFKELFNTSPCKHPIVFLKDVSYSTMEQLLIFMYKGEVAVENEHIATLIKTAEALQIKGLSENDNLIGPEKAHLEEDEEEENGEVDFVENIVKTRKHKNNINKDSNNANNNKNVNVSVNNEEFSIENERMQISNLYEEFNIDKRSIEVNTVIKAEVEEEEEEENNELEILKEEDFNMTNNTTALFFKSEPEDFDEEEEEDEEEDEMDLDKKGVKKEGKKLRQSIIRYEDGEGQVAIYMRTQRGRKCLIIDNNLYYVNRMRGKNTFWVCSDYHKKRCKSRCVTYPNGSLKKRRNGHNHPPHHDRIKEQLLPLTPNDLTF